ncbi:MAG: hypothetical protein QNJ01_12345 [Desulfobacterales bacterium]|nr:hypothetical protein [Desulfobacterales bacterium]
MQPRHQRDKRHLLKIAYLHYHLKPGGVTTVIRQQVQNRPHETASIVLCGEESPPSPFPGSVVVVPGIGYDGTVGTEKPAMEIAAAVDQAIKRAFGGAGRCDLIHIHNPVLAKNRQFPEIIRHLQSMGYPLLLQVHDFAEDGRPAVYYRRDAYPADCHYSVINRRDYGFLEECGLDRDGLHYLPNSVASTAPSGPEVELTDFVLYPVRAIRRKNIGEALLLSAFLPPHCQLFITLPPNSPGDFPAYRRWQQLVMQTRLPVRFEMGLAHDFNTLLSQAHHVVSTSISEGFGFAFLESWLAGKGMEGRLLPDICRDFSEAGIDLDHLYPRLHIPLDWIGRDRLIQRFQKCYRHNCRLFAPSHPMPTAQAFTAPLHTQDTVDFGMLDEPLQTDVINAVISDSAKQNQLQDLNPALMRMGRETDAVHRIESNRERILAVYGQKAAAERLERVYERVVNRPVRHRIDKSRLVSKFLKYSNFSLLKWMSNSNG